MAADTVGRHFYVYLLVSKFSVLKSNNTYSPVMRCPPNAATVKYRFYCTEVNKLFSCIYTERKWMRKRHVFLLGSWATFTFMFTNSYSNWVAAMMEENFRFRSVQMHPQYACFIACIFIFVLSFRPASVKAWVLRMILTWMTLTRWNSDLQMSFDLQMLLLASVCVRAAKAARPIKTHGFTTLPIRLDTTCSYWFFLKICSSDWLINSLDMRRTWTLLNKIDCDANIKGTEIFP